MTACVLGHLGSRDPARTWAGRLDRSSVSGTQRAFVMSQSAEMLSGEVMAGPVRLCSREGLQVCSHGRGRTGGQGPASVGTAPSFPSRRKPTLSGSGLDAPGLTASGRQEAGPISQSGPSIPHGTRVAGPAWLSPSLGLTPSLGKIDVSRLRMRARPPLCSSLRPPRRPPRQPPGLGRQHRLET